MNNITIGFIITFISGLSTMIGYFFIFFNIKNKNRYISNCLFFSSFIMLVISFFDLIPASFSYINKIYDFIPSVAIMAIYVVFGGIFIYVIDKININDNKLYKLGIVSLIALVLHNIPEGIITFLTTSKNISLGLSLSVSIALHNIPEGIIISIPIYYGNRSRKKALLYTFIAALSEPLGALISYLFLYNINNYTFSIILSFTAGVMIYLSIFELLLYGIKYKKEKDVF